MLSATADLVRRQSPRAANEAIETAINRSVFFHLQHPNLIDRRLQELDEEWDIERALEANAATIALTGVVLAATVDRRFLAVPGIVAAFLLQHALQGWCPPLPVLRQFGLRTAQEINRERVALKALRGDFNSMPNALGESRGEVALNAARL
jgi:hypothetical protein